jgi:hypothetical protein
MYARHHLNDDDLPHRPPPPDDAEQFRRAASEFISVVMQSALVGLSLTEATRVLQHATADLKRRRT